MANDKITKEYLRRKPKTRGEEILNFISSPKVARLWFAALFLLFFAPILVIPVLSVAYLLIRHQVLRIPAMPFFMPMHTGIKSDPFNIKPAKGEKGEVYVSGAAGIAYFGNEVGDYRQAWMGAGFLLQHIAFLAATGSGKTFTISGIACANALIWGAGYIFIDAKADTDIVDSHGSNIWRTNRIDDFFVMNFINGGANAWDEFNGTITTHTYNMLESKSRGQDTETLKTILPGDGDIWQKRAEAMISGLMSPLKYLQINNYITLSIPSLLDYLTVESAGRLCGDPRVPAKYKRELFGFLKTLPGMTQDMMKQVQKGESVKSPQVYDQWGFASMQVILVVNSLSGDYGKIFNPPVGMINLESIVFTDRILLGLLPALEVSASNIAAMGRIVMAARKGLMGRSLGNVIEGNVRMKKLLRPTGRDHPYCGTPIPFLNVMDECGMIFAESEGVVSAQSRGLGYSQWYLAQDLSAMKKLSQTVEKEVDTVMGNTIIKICGKIIEESTFELFRKLAGETFVWQRDRSSLEFEGGRVRSNEDSASYTKVDQLEMTEVQALREGELFVCTTGRLKRVNAPNLLQSKYAIKVQKLNEFVPFIPYDKEYLERMEREVNFLDADYYSLVNNKEKHNPVEPPKSSGLEKFIDMFSIVLKNSDRPEFSVLVSLAGYTYVQQEEILRTAKSADLAFSRGTEVGEGQLDYDEPSPNEDTEQPAWAVSTVPPAPEIASQEQSEEGNPNGSASGSTPDFASMISSDTLSESQNSSSDKAKSGNKNSGGIVPGTIQPNKPAQETPSPQNNSEPGEFDTSKSTFENVLAMHGLSKEGLKRQFADINKLTARVEMMQDAKTKALADDVPFDHQQANDFVNQNAESPVEQTKAEEAAVEAIKTLEYQGNYPDLPVPKSDVARTCELLSKAYETVTGKPISISSSERDTTEV